MKNLDIKNFTTLSGVTIGDYFLMVTKMETDGKLSVESFVTYMRNLAQPQISETTGNWVFAGIDGSTIDTGSLPMWERGLKLRKNHSILTDRMG